MQSKQPVVLCLSGHDPSGGAGIQADIETLNSHHCHCCSVITALTEQDTQNVYKIIPQQANDIIDQATRLFKDYHIQCIKIGLIGDVNIAVALQKILLEHPDIPVVLDPVLAAGGGMSVANTQLIHTISELLLPRTTILTPNSIEARKLANNDELSECGFTLLNMGCEYVLLTGTHEETAVVTNQLFNQNQILESYDWDRLEQSYHGSGCTLASSLAALIAHGLDMQTAALEAQEYTWNSLKAASQPGLGQYIPDRLFWTKDG